MNASAAPPRRSFFRLALRWLGMLAVVYVGVLLWLLFFENKLVYRPATAADDWQESSLADMEDVELTAADGTCIHGWYLPQRGSDLALLYFHGNAGNLSHRGSSVAKLRQVLKVSVLIIDYP